MEPTLPERAGEEREKEALRIQAAAVAAQQAALAEEEARLHQRRLALEQQEAQLAAHLDEKRRRLIELRDHTREAHAALQEDRAAYERRRRELEESAAQARDELAYGQQQVAAERRRVLGLRQRLRRRWHRHWAAERAAMRRGQEQLASQSRELDKQRQQLQQHKAALDQARLRLNGEVELGRRQLQDGWRQLRHAQQQWAQHCLREQTAFRERLQALDQRQTALVQAERVLAKEERRWQTTRLDLEKETEGLQTRISHQRRKLREQEREVSRLEALLQELQEGARGSGRAFPAGDDNSAAASPSPACPPPDDPTGSHALTGRATPTAPGDTACREAELCQAEDELQRRAAALERMFGELADQRLHLAEQCQRLVESQERWQQERDAAAADLEALGLRLQEREQALVGREQALERALAECRQRLADIEQQGRKLDSWQARLASRSAAWEGERDRQVADLRTREALADCRLVIVAKLRRQWQRRQQQEVERLQAEYAACRQLREQYTALREEWLQRSSSLEQEQRLLAQRAAALEQYRHKGAPGAADAAAERRLQRLHRRLAGLCAAEEQSLLRQRQALATEAASLEQRQRQLEHYAAAIASRSARLSKRAQAWQHQRALAATERARQSQQIHCLQEQRRAFERQLQDLQEEVERLARLLLNEPDSAPATAVQAA